MRSASRLSAERNERENDAVESARERRDEFAEKTYRITPSGMMHRYVQALQVTCGPLTLFHRAYWLSERAVLEEPSEPAKTAPSK